MAHPRAQGQGPCPPREPERTRPHPPIFRLIEALAKLKPASFILDGKVAMFDEELISRFEGSGT